MYVTVYNDKGGSCKSTFVREMALFLEREKKQPLIVDLDYKNSITHSFGIKARKNIYHLMDKMARTDDVLVRTEFVDVIPGGYEVINAEINKGLRACFEEIESYYDYIFVDTAGQNKVSEMALYESDIIIVPVIPQRYDVFNFEHTMNYINDIKTPTQRIFVLIMRSDESETSQTEIAIIEDIVKEKKATLLKRAIRNDETVKEIQIKERELRSYNFVSDAAEDYKELSLELIRRLDAHKEDMKKLKILLEEQIKKEEEKEEENKTEKDIEDNKEE